MAESQANIRPLGSCLALWKSCGRPALRWICRYSFPPLRIEAMLYPILIVVFLAAGFAFYLLFDPIQQAMQRSVFRQKEHVKTELDEMFIFISVEALQTIKWCAALAIAGIALVVTWDAKPPAPQIVAALLGMAGYWLPEILIIYLRHKRRAAFSEQLVDGL